MKVRARCRRDVQPNTNRSCSHTDRLLEPLCSVFNMFAEMWGKKRQKICLFFFHTLDVTQNVLIRCFRLFQIKATKQKKKHGVKFTVSVGFIWNINISQQTQKMSIYICQSSFWQEKQDFFSILFRIKQTWVIHTHTHTHLPDLMQCIH